ncbi:MAG: 2OG-Fe(II) oxygenase [Hellea sp.]
MNTQPINLNPYFQELIVLEGGLLKHEIARIKSGWKEEEAKKAEVSSASKYDETLRKSKVMSLLDTESNGWIYDRLLDIAKAYNQQCFGFDITNFLETLQIACYGEGDFFGWHLDFGAGEISHRKISLTVQLSDPNDYEGGDLQFMANDEIISVPRTLGTIVIFPSFILHRVTEITRGRRESIVGWVAGPPYR